MRLEDLTVTLRPRQPWEAVDLGCALVRRDFGRVFALWASTVFPVWGILCVLMRASPEWIPLLVWWLKPLYDRVPLFFLSRSAFGVRPGFVETWKEWPRLWLVNFLPALLWRRLSLIRSFALPAQMLEGLRGSAANQRVKTLAYDGGGSGFAVTYGFLKLESVLVIGLMWGTYGFLPERVVSDLRGMLEAVDFSNALHPALYWWAAFCYMAVVTLIEPFYVGAGFALYLNCRTRIEGWDVELAFRRMASRLRGAAAACLIGLACIAGLQGPAAHAEGDAKTVVEEILRSPDFEIHKIQSQRWVPDETEKDDEEEKKREKDKARARERSSWANFSFGGMGSVGFAILWGLLIAVVVFIVVYGIKNRHVLASGVQKQAPKVVMGLNITPESLPDDVVASARAAWAAGDFKEALSLLYRGALSWLVTRRRVPISDSDTEEDCVVQVMGAGEKTEAEYFRHLTGAWVQAAYALLPVSNEEMDTLCDRWPFREKGGAP